MVFSEVSRTPDVKKIQMEIAEQIGLTLDKETEHARASMLYAQLKKSRKILVILDNVWTELHLKDVGIPFGDEHKGCKVLLTTRGRDLLSRMGSEADVRMDILNEEEAWRLFEVKLGNDGLIRRMKSTATQIVKQCGGLPIALEPIAKALRNKTESECWKNALHELRMPTENNFHRELGKAYTAIKLSYDALKGEQLKKIFQLCSLMPKSFFASDLFKYCIGLGIFRGINMEDARNTLYTLVHELKDSCLLLEGYSCREFSMHDVVHDVAILIACGEQKEFLVRNGDVWEWPDKDALKKCYAISWIDSSGGELPEGLECPQLELLLLSSKHSSVDVNIPRSFFTGMRELKVVDLTNMQLFSLPSSIDLLLNLRTLCLDHGTLGDITIIDLPEFGGTGGDFPQDRLFGSLKDMEVRDDDSASVPIGLLEKFHGLENLNLSFCSYKELFSNGGQVHLIKKLELICLNDLEYLWIPNSNMGDSILQNLEILKSNLTELLQLQVDSCQKLMNLVTPSGAKSLVRLESLTIYGCSAMTQVVISEGDAAAAKEEIVFIKLKSLDLHHLDSLTSFSSGNYTFRFPSLEYLCVIGCPKMKIFTAGDLRTLTESVCYGYGHGEWRSDSNINKIIHQLHEEKLLEKPSMSEVLVNKVPECSDTDEDSSHFLCASSGIIFLCSCLVLAIYFIVSLQLGSSQV
ncbi:hypothetical protein CUMW_254200 [Citrus unshiu]|uniref:Uncharacterized protein n=1 Tax=Citrus unshiu TaxID=55188 RepID=A0A2H5QRA4_CITUN|nr:hypothetical protein CUMW_254200 [Citrus unshiu]